MQKKLIKVILLVCFLLASIFALILITEPKGDAPKGMYCFNKCSQICQENQSKVYTFTATQTTCGCTCFNGYQKMFKN